MVLQRVFIFDAVIFVWFGSFANMSWLLTLFLPGFVCVFASVLSSGSLFSSSFVLSYVVLFGLGFVLFYYYSF